MSRPSEVYVRPLSTEEEQWVHRLYQQTTHVGLKSRCHIILLSTQHYSVQHPVLSVSSPDPEYEQKCARLQNLQQRALAGEIDLYYEDEVDLALLPVECR